MTTRGTPPVLLVVSDTLVKPALSNSDLVPVYAKVLLRRAPALSAGYPSRIAAPFALAKSTTPVSRADATPFRRWPGRTTKQMTLQTG